MAKSVSALFRSLERRIETIIMDVLWEYANKILEAIPSDLRIRYGLVREKDRVLITTDSELVAYIEFGTGVNAEQYLAGKPREMQEEAIKFYVNGKGTMRPRPHLFPAYYAVKDQIPIEINRRVQRLLDTL